MRNLIKSPLIQLFLSDQRKYLKMNQILSHIVVFLFITSSFAQNNSQLNSVMAWAEADASKGILTLKWKKQANDSSFEISRKLKDENVWPIFPIARLPRTASEFVDSTTKFGEAYEYRIRRKAGNIFSETYLFGGVKVKSIDVKKTILLLIEESIKSGIQPDLNTLKEDLQNETWNVAELVVPKTMTAIEVKDKLWEVYDLYPDLSSIFIIGHVAVPYSGNQNWDGHPDHMGAWVCDNYYADINGFWADEFVNNSSPTRPENKNLVGDGKFDDSFLPTDLEFEVGRVDFFNMPTFKKSEVELLKNYLRKDHNHRIAKTRAVRRAIVQDNFDFAQEFFGSSGYKNYTVLVGPDSVKTESFRDQLLQKSYLLAYGAGGGHYQGAGGIATSGQLAVDSLQAVFTFLFGSYFGDWDVQDNFLRASLGSGTILTTAWAGRPSWYIQHMSMGETIGYSTLITNNNQPTYKGNPYFSSYRPAHVSLLGDPSLTLLPVIPPTSLIVTESNGSVNLNWIASSEASEGYTIMRRIMPVGKFEMIANNIKALTYTDKCLKKDSTYEYLVAAVKLETNASGTFYNRSAGTRASILIKSPTVTKASMTSTLDYEFLVAKSTSTNSKSNLWKINGQTITGDSIKISLDCNPKFQDLVLESIGECNNDVTITKLNIECSIPELIRYTNKPEIKCFGDLTNLVLDSIQGANPFTFKWSNGATSNSVNNVSGNLSVEITSSKGTKKAFNINLPQPTQIVINNILVKNVNQGFNLGRVTGIDATGGVPPYTYKVLNVAKQDSLPVGIYTLEIIDANGCKQTKTFEIKLNVATKNLTDHKIAIYPNPAKDELFIESKQLIKSINIISVEGKLIISPTVEKYGDNNYKIDISNLAPAYYQLQINDNNQRIGFVKG